MLYPNQAKQAYAKTEQQSLRQDRMPVYGERMKARRTALKISLKDMADKLGLKAYQQYYDWEQNRVVPPVKYLEPLSRILLCSVDHLLGLVDEPGATLEEEDLSEVEIQLIRKRRESEFFRAATDLLLRGFILKSGQVPPSSLVESGEQSDTTGQDDGVQ